MGFRNGATMDNLPDVVLSNIFIRLLAKQIAQMRCVSKSWNALLSQSSFIKSHLNRSIQNNNNDNGILLLFPDLFSFASKPFTAHPSRSPHLELTNFIKLPLNHPQSHNTRGQVIGSVNGLICFKYESNHDPDFIYGSNRDPEVIYIWNPSLSALLTLPPSYTPSHSVQKFFRFGYDPETDDYKVVKVTRRIEKQGITIFIKEWLQPEVYSMRKGSWKFIPQKLPSHVTDLSDSGKICVDGHDGHLHWHAEINQCWNSVDTVLAFDLGAETFREMPLPDYVTKFILDGSVDGVPMDLGVLAGKVCVMTRALPDYECEVWVMNEYGVAKSWVKLHDFPSFCGDLYTYGFTSHNEFFFQVLGCGLALYDPVAAKTKIFKYYDENENYGVGKVVEYVDSLVWVTPTVQREMSSCGISQL